MNPKNFLLNTRDVKGRLIPGIILFLNIYYLIMKPPDFNINFTITTIIIGIIFMYVLGDINSFVSFQIFNGINSLVNNKKNSESFLSDSVLKNEKIKDYFDNKFDCKKSYYYDEHLKTFCKNALIIKNIDLFYEIDKISAEINFKINIIIPLIFSAIYLFLKSEFIIIPIFIIIIVVLFIIDAKKSKDKELRSIYENYYIVSQKK